MQTGDFHAIPRCVPAFLGSPRNLGSSILCAFSRGSPDPIDTLSPRGSVSLSRAKPQGRPLSSGAGLSHQHFAAPWWPPEEEQGLVLCEELAVLWQELWAGFHSRLSSDLLSSHPPPAFPLVHPSSHPSGLSVCCQPLCATPPGASSLCLRADTSSDPGAILPCP